MLVARLAATMLYDHLMSAGVEIYEYCKRPLHGKVACMDDDWCTVGSSNLDPLSLALHLEANVVARDASLNAALRDSLERLIAQDCKPVPKSAKPTRALRRFWVGVVVFHFLRRFPAWAGARPPPTPPRPRGAAPATISGTLAALASAINHRDCSRGGFCKLADGSCSRVLAPPLTRRYGWRAGHANALHAARTTLH
ncbi:hypothetical protein G6F57_016703 [Rhizopus arrhizus]|nr:hypothetical protein G6F57_016703 [Rhizopus arrhizus]